MRDSCPGILGSSPVSSTKALSTVSVSLVIGKSFPPTNRAARGAFRICALSAEPEGRLVGVEDHFHLGAVVGLHLPEADDLAHDLGVVADRLGFGVDIADVVGDALFFFLEAFDALDEEAQAVVGGSGHRK